MKTVKSEGIIDDLKNRSLCKTLIFKNIPYNSNNENSWNETKNVLVAEIAKVLPNTPSEVVPNLLKEPIVSPQLQKEKDPLI